MIGEHSYENDIKQELLEGHRITKELLGYSTTEAKQQTEILRKGINTLKIIHLNMNITYDVKY